MADSKWSNQNTPSILLGSNREELPGSCVSLSPPLIPSGNSFYHLCLRSTNTVLFLLFTLLDTTALSKHLTITKLEKQPCSRECRGASTASFCKETDLTSYSCDLKASNACRDQALFPFSDILLEQKPKHLFVIGNAHTQDDINSNLLKKLHGLMGNFKTIVSGSGEQKSRNLIAFANSNQSALIENHMQISLK